MKTKDTHDNERIKIKYKYRNRNSDDEWTRKDCIVKDMQQFKTNHAVDEENIEYRILHIESIREQKSSYIDI